MRDLRRTRSLDFDLVATVTAAVAARLGFWIISDRTWEDALITEAHARNASLGLGLVHHPGDGVVQGFTSALSVLIPLAADFLIRDSGLIAIRLASLVAVVAALYIARRITSLLGLSRWASFLVLAYLALDQNQIFYGMAGMETQVAVALLLASVWCVLARRASFAGVLLGLDLLVRPDFIIWVVCGLIGLALVDRRAALRSALVAAIVVSPWVIFTSMYYGSPVPQTIVAKVLVSGRLPTGGDLQVWVMWIPAALSNHVPTMLRTFMPFLEDTMAVAAPVPTIVLVATAIAMWALAIRGAFVTWRVTLWRPAIAFVALYAVYRMTLLPIDYSDWYVPPFSALCVILAASGLDRVGLHTRALALAASVLSLAFAVNVPFTIGMAARVQGDIETGVRQRVGEYLSAEMAPGDAFLSESAGYFGYYSRRTEYDYPGLTSRASLATLNTLSPDRRTLSGLAAALQPPWLVLRPNELASLRTKFPSVAARYRVRAEFTAPETDGLVGFGGFTLWTIDEDFIVLSRE